MNLKIALRRLSVGAEQTISFRRTFVRRQKIGEPTKVAFLEDCTTPDLVRNGVKTAFEFIGAIDSLISPGKTVLLKPNVNIEIGNSLLCSHA